MRDVKTIYIHKKVKNKYNLPKAIVRAVQNDTYSKEGSDISTTTLIKPPRLVQLQRVHALDIEEDVSDLIFSLLGQSVHHVIERAALNSDISEQRIFYSGPETLDWKLSGQVDLLQEDGSLIDFKVTSAWSALDAIENGKLEWEQQLNVYDFIASHNDMNVKSLSILAILRDWSKVRVMQSDNYPRKQVVMIPIRRWSKQEQADYIRTRVALHQSAIKTKSNELPICTPQERWSTPDTFAVMKKGRKKAVRVLDSQLLAEKYLEQNNLEDGKDAVVVHRVGEDVRCEHYCPVNKFCNYYKEGVKF